jgi:hypothetical protein
MKKKTTTILKLGKRKPRQVKGSLTEQDRARAAAGNGQPLDPKKDFQDEQAPAAARAAEQLTTADLEAEAEGPEAPEQVENGMALMQFVRVKPARDRTKKRFLELELSVGLTEESAPLFGSAIEDRYAILRDDAGVTALSISDAPAHTIDIAMAPGGESVIHAVIQPQKVNLHAVQEKGSGEERTVIRLQFVAPIAQTDELAKWACATHGELVWVNMGETQGMLV